MDVFLSSIVAGLAIGSIFGLVGVGATVTFNATRVFNLAQGDLVMVGIMASYYGLDVLKLPQSLDFLLVLAVVALLALIEERTVVRPFLRRRGEGRFGWFIATLGFASVVETVVRVAFGTHPIVAIPSPLPLAGIRVGDAVIGYRQLLVIGTFVTVVVLLDRFYARTWTGQAMRAVAEDREAAALIAINPDVMSRSAFLIAGISAGLGGFVIAPIKLSDPTVGLGFTLKGFLALAIGGFGSIRGAVTGALALGVCEQLFDTYVSSNYEILVGAGLALIVLVLRPEGLFRTTAARSV